MSDEKDRGNRGIESLREIAGEVQDARGEQDGKPTDKPEAEGRCLAEIWFMPNGRAQLRCSGEDRFLVQQAMRDIILNVDRELILEAVESKLKEFERRIGGGEKKRVWTPEGRA